MRFHVLYDEPTKLYWLLGTQATDSMTRPDALPADRYQLPNNERTRLVLHFSKNMVDWCFAGLVAVGPGNRGARHYASMDIDGDDLVILARSGDERAQSAHNGNLINAQELREELEGRGVVFESTNDSEVIARLVAEELHHGIAEAVRRAMERIQGAYSLAILTKDALIAALDGTREATSAEGEA